MARPVTSDPSLPLSSCPVDRRKSPRFHGLLKDAVEFSPRTHVLLAVLFVRGSKACPKGRITNVKVCLEPQWPSCPALLSWCPWAACTVPLSPSPPQAVESPCSVQLFSHACTDEFLTAPAGQSWCFGSLGFLDHCCFVLMCCSMVCSGSHASQALGSFSRIFSRIRVIQTSCTGRLKSCNPRLCARTAVSDVSGSSVTHLKVYRH